MRGKILLVVGLGVGYVLGARAGRQRYEEIVRAAQGFWNDPRVQKQVNHAEEFVKDKGEDVAEYLTDGAKKVVSQVTGSKGAAKPKTGSGSSAGKASTSGPSTAKK